MKKVKDSIWSRHHYTIDISSSKFDKFDRDLVPVILRSHYDKALVDEFIRRGIDISVVYDGRSISFAHLVNYDSSRNRLIAVG
ncbi:MAG: hypothetical protein IJJ68_07830 [Prevotella sp.]|nr:hypothetical protein [Prevotella sp.]